MSTSPRRVVLLDILRVLAIALVIGRHLPPLEEATPKWFHPIAEQWIDFGWIGVDLFFVLSGFLISGLLFREYQKYGNIRVGRFLARRGFKIYPPFYIMIATVIYIQATNANFNPNTPGKIFAEVFFYQNYHEGLLDCTWTLAVEEHFYLLLPLVLLFFIRRGGGKGRPFRWLPLVSLLIFAVEIAARIVTTKMFDYSYRINLMPTHLRLDSLLFGVLISYYYHFYPERTMRFAKRFRWFLVVAGVGLVVPVCVSDLWSFFVSTFGYTFLYVGFGMILLGGLAFQMPTVGWRSIPVRVLAFVGAHSYSIYLWHMPFKIWGPMYCERWFGLKPTPLAQLWVYVVGAIAGGIALSMVIEKPALAIRDRLAPSPSKALEANSSGKAILEPASV